MFSICLSQEMYLIRKCYAWLIIIIISHHYYPFMFAFHAHIAWTVHHNLSSYSESLLSYAWFGSHISLHFIWVWHLRFAALPKTSHCTVCVLQVDFYLGTYSREFVLSLNSCSHLWLKRFCYWNILAINLLYLFKIF